VQGEREASLKEMCDLIGNQVCDLVITWKWWKSLFVCENHAERAALLKIANGVSFELQRLGSEHICLAFWRLIHDKRKEVLGFKHVIDELAKARSDAAVGELRGLHEQLKLESRAIESFRNNQVGHLNRDVLVQGHDAATGLTIDLIDSALRGLQELLNRVREACGDCQIVFEPADETDAELLGLLRASQTLREVRQHVYSGETALLVHRLKMHYESWRR
jgi:hypothetical protein